MPKLMQMVPSQSSEYENQMLQIPIYFLLQVILGIQ